jgi:hypothetical protein
MSEFFFDAYVYNSLIEDESRHRYRSLLHSPANPSIVVV